MPFENSSLLFTLSFSPSLFSRETKREETFSFLFFENFESRNVSVNPRIDRMDGAQGIPETVSRIIDVSKMMRCCSTR